MNHRWTQIDTARLTPQPLPLLHLIKERAGERRRVCHNSLVRPSPRSSPHSFVGGRGRNSVSPNLCPECANLRDCITDKKRKDHAMREIFCSVGKSLKPHARSPTHPLTRSLSDFLICARTGETRC